MPQFAIITSITFALKLLDKLRTEDLFSSILRLNSTSNCQLFHLVKMKLTITAKFAIHCLSQAIGSFAQTWYLAYYQECPLLSIPADIREHIDSWENKQVNARNEVVSKYRFLEKILHRRRIVICKCKRSQIDASLALKGQQTTLARVAAPMVASTIAYPKLRAWLAVSVNCEVLN